MAEREKKYRRIGWITSIATQLVLLILFYFLIAWREPFPPIPSYGIELSFGFEDAGKSQKPLSNPEPLTEETEIEEEAVEEAAENPEESEPAEELMKEIPADPVETEQIPITDQPSPDVTRELPKEVPKETVKAEKVTEPVEKKEVKKPEEAKKEEKKPAVNPQAAMPPASTTTEAVNTTKGTTEDKGSEGKEEGTIDGRALMGEQGSADGASLQMAGWVWDSKPKPNDDSPESGTIVYRIKVDSDGYLIGIVLKSNTVSPVVERYYRQSVERLSFSKTSDYKSAVVSEGTITFIIRAK